MLAQTGRQAFLISIGSGIQNPCPPACLRLLFHPSQQKSPWAETRSENVSSTSASPEKDKGPTGDFASRRELNQRVPEPWDRLCPPGPSTTNSNLCSPTLWQCRDKGVSTNKAVTSTLLFCCPNEPTRPGICAAAIWDIQSSKKKQSPSLARVLVINKPLSTEFQTFASFIGAKSAGKCGEAMALPNPDGSLGRNN